MTIYLIPAIGVESYYHSQFLVNGLLETGLNFYRSASRIETGRVLKGDIKCELHFVL